MSFTKRLVDWTTASGHTLTPLVPEDDGGVDVEVIDVSDPAQLRRAADVVVASSVGIPGQRNVLADALRAEADRLDVEAADRAKAEQIARDHLGHGRWTATVRSTQNAITEAVLAGNRANEQLDRIDAIHGPNECPCPNCRHHRALDGEVQG